MYHCNLAPIIFMKFKRAIFFPRETFHLRETLTYISHRVKMCTIFFMQAHPHSHSHHSNFICAKSLKTSLRYSETSNNGLSERRTTSVQRIKSMPPIALPIEIVYLEPPRSGHLSTLDNGQPACLQRTAVCTK